MNRSQLQDMLGGPLTFGRARKSPGIASFFRAAEPHLWCAMCTRTFPNGVHRLVGDSTICPYRGCTGNIATQSFEWRHVRDQHPNYPATPSMSVQYPYAISAG